MSKRHVISFSDMALDWIHVENTGITRSTNLLSLMYHQGSQ